VAACAAVSGLQSYSYCNGGDCDTDATMAPEDDGASRASMDVQNVEPAADVVATDEPPPEGDDAGDATSGDDGTDAAQSPDAPQVDASDAGEAGPTAMEAGATEAGASHDAGSAADASDGACTSTHSVDNCGACGVACNTSTGTPSCNGVACSYSCNSDKVDCNAGVAPDTDGCECAGTACCGNTCQTAHESGLSSPAATTYYNCSAAGNSTQIEATNACLGVGASDCLFQTTTGCLGTVTNAVCGTVSGTCYCWMFSGYNAGTVATALPCNAVPCTQGNPWN
jgi:hypothetical protein